MSIVFVIITNVCFYKIIIYQDNNVCNIVFPDNRLNNKELPTTKWRRDRRIRMSSEYHSSPSSPIAVKPLSESNSSNSATSPNALAASPVGHESPLDMSVSANKPPPPPYREPLPGSQFVHHQTHLARPSVITQAPKRDSIGANQENNRVAPVGKLKNLVNFYIYK